MTLDKPAILKRLRAFDFPGLFTQELGWDSYRAALSITLGDLQFQLRAVAQKRGMAVFTYDASDNPAAPSPDYQLRRKIERQVAKSAHEHLIIFTDAGRTSQIWQWVKRELEKPTICREHTYHVSQDGEALYQKLFLLSVSLADEEQLTIIDVHGKVKSAFDIDKLTKRFYERFQVEHARFLKFIEGIVSKGDRQWYTSIMLNRLMFIYFIQKKGFLDNDPHYLRNRLKTIQRQKGKDKFQSFYRYFLIRMMHEGLGLPQNARKLDQQFRALLGNVPYLNGGIFEQHKLEIENADLDIPDQAFEHLFNFFDEFQWHLDERPLRNDREINPDVLGYIFEKYINQKQMGAYYTKEDITGYIAKSTILPFIFDKARNDPKNGCAVAFKSGSALWRLLRDDPDRYIYISLRQGVIDDEGSSIPLPADIAAGMTDVTKRGGWNKPAAPEFALPTETWREHVARRQRCLELRAKLAAGQVNSINELITLNLDIRQFAQDVIENCEGPELLSALYHAIFTVTILDPTCGSGAFLFAALNILEPLYEACLDRMERFIADADALAKAKPPSQRQQMAFEDFRKTLAAVAEHRNPRYFIFKSIILNNLFGVDIMEEAVEICRLRLFLKLIAQVEPQQGQDNLGVEPLPDIDFNIRAGNTLVGFTSVDDVRRSQEGKLGFAASQIAEIERTAGGVDQMFRQFRRLQTDVRPDAVQISNSKCALRTALDRLNKQLDCYLAEDVYGIFGIKGFDAKKFDVWQKGHQPFHWITEFYGIMITGGFDVLIGNPPYLDLKGFNDYRFIPYATLPCGNLYALVLERCRYLVKPDGRHGFIVPVSSISTEGYSSLQRLLLDADLIVSSFDDRPSHLFDGLDKNTLSILLSSRFGAANHASVLCTRLNRWNSQERAGIFERLQYAPIASTQLPGCLPKIGNSIESSLWQKLFASGKRLAEFYRSTGAEVYYSRKVNSFMQALDFTPEVRNGQGQLRQPSEFKTLIFPSPGESRNIYCLLNSTLFRWFMDVVSDGSHLNKRELDNFPFTPTMEAKLTRQLAPLAEKLTERFKSTSVTRVMRYKHDTLTVQCIIGKNAKPEVDEIDRVLAKHYGFTDEELDFIINYDIKYRMGGQDDDANKSAED